MRRMSLFDPWLPMYRTGTIWHRPWWRAERADILRCDGVTLTPPSLLQFEDDKRGATLKDESVAAAMARIGGWWLGARPERR